MQHLYYWHWNESLNLWVTLCNLHFVFFSNMCIALHMNLQGFVIILWIILITCAQGCSQAQQAFRECYDKWSTKIIFSVHTVSYGSPIFLIGAINRTGKNLVCNLQLYRPPFLFPESALHLVSTKNHDLWEVPTPVVCNSQTSYRSVHVQSQV